MLLCELEGCKGEGVVGERQRLDGDEARWTPKGCGAGIAMLSECGTSDSTPWWGPALEVD